MDTAKYRLDYLESQGDDFTTLNMQLFKELLSYFTYLYNKGEISEKVLEALVRYSCSVYIENEIENRIQKTLERKLTEFLAFKLPGSIEKSIAGLVN